jgi:dinuclear metal center YbgI/SA1388 family protein
MRLLLDHDMAVYSAHLPLDVHPLHGNNARLGTLLKLQQVQPVAAVEPVGVLMQGQSDTAISPAAFAELLQTLTGRTVLLHQSARAPALIRRIAWCSGGGQGYLPQAVAAGAELFFSGEVSEQTIHQADELGIHFIAAGHHATERYGVQALGQWLASQTGIEVEFIDMDNPA